MTYSLLDYLSLTFILTRRSFLTRVTKILVRAILTLERDAGSPPLAYSEALSPVP